MISTRSAGLVIDTVVCLTLAKWETVSGQFGGYLKKPFAVSKFEVTWDAWDACVKYDGCAENISDSAWGHGTRPVINVTWEQVQQYVTWLSKMTGKTYLLLTETEWEYAARAGTSTAYSWGDEIGDGKANCSGCDK